MHAEHFHRRSIRLPEYDYSQAGFYYLTIGTHQRAQLFGRVVDGQMHLNTLGQIAHDEWLRTAEVRKNVVLDAFVVMPNHVHVLFWIVDDANTDTPAEIHTGLSRLGISCTDVSQYAPLAQFRSPSKTVGAIIRGYKGAATKQINRIRNTPGTPVWQRNFYERVVRDECEANNTRRYINNNQMQWHLDRLNPGKN